VNNLPDPAQFDRFIHILTTDQNRPVCFVILFLLSTGARLNEALNAKWADIDKINRLWVIPAKTSKSKKIRSIPLSDSALEILDKLGTEGNFEYLFRSRSGEKFTTIAKVFDRLRKAAGMPKFRAHDARHYFASRLLNNNVSIGIVQSLLGHADIKTTLVYSHLQTKTLLDAANTVGDDIHRAIQKAELKAAELEMPKAA